MRKQTGAMSSVIFQRSSFFMLCVLCLAPVAALAQSGRQNAKTRDENGSVINVFASRDDDSKESITQKNLALYENGVELTIKSFVSDPSPSRIILLVDNSLTSRTEIQKLEKAVEEFIYQIYEGDQMMIVGYDDNAEIVSDWTDDPKKVEATLKNFRKKGSPRLFDALAAVLDEAVHPVRVSNRKVAIVLVGDGLDRDSQTKFKDVLADLQKSDVTVYALQLPDRTGGAIQRNQPKPAQVIQKLTEGTGGLIFDIKDALDASKKICDELKSNRYLLSYQPGNFSVLDDRRVLVIADHGIIVRSKTIQPAIASQ